MSKREKEKDCPRGLSLGVSLALSLSLSLGLGAKRGGRRRVKNTRGSEIKRTIVRKMITDASR